MSAAELATLAATDVREALEQEALLRTMTSPPFVYVPGTFNTRDLGLVPSPRASGTSTPIPLANITPDPTGTAVPAAGAGLGAVGNKLRPGFVFRSGALDGLTPQGKAQLASALGIKRVFDLRSEGERHATPDPDVPGAENVWSATEEKEATAALHDFVPGLGEEGYEKMYLDVLHVYKGPFRAVLEHIRDRPDEPLLYHCTAGRDRTGVLSGLINSLGGQDPETIALDFMLSRIGTEPAREMLLMFVMKGTGAKSVEEPGFYNLCSLRASCWDAFVAGVERKYDGFDGYARTALGFSDEELATIRRNLSHEWK